MSSLLELKLQLLQTDSVLPKHLKFFKIYVLIPKIGFGFLLRVKKP